jgi:hypothetical protein
MIRATSILTMLILSTLTACSDGGPLTPSGTDVERFVETAEQPDIFFVDLDDPALEGEEGAFFTALCGFPIQADFEGGFVVHLFNESNRGPIQVNSFRTKVTYSNEEGEEVRHFLAGPSIVYFDDDVLVLAASGRDLSFTGRIVLDADTLEILFFSGRSNGQPIEAGETFVFSPTHVCDALS